MAKNGVAEADESGAFDARTARRQRPLPFTPERERCRPRFVRRREFVFAPLERRSHLT